MCVITNHIHYVTKINQTFPIFLAYVEKHGEAWVQGLRYSFWLGFYEVSHGYLTTLAEVLRVYMY